MDMLFRVLLVNNVDPVCFSRQNDCALEDFPVAASDELITLIQQFVVETEPDLTPAQLVGHGLAASAVPSPAPKPYFI